MDGSIYESDPLLHQYLLFHYGSLEETLPWQGGPAGAFGYPERVVSECFEPSTLPPGARGLDLGCAVGRSTFEMAKFCSEAVGIDFSARFVAAAEALRTQGRLPYSRVDEGDIVTSLIARRPDGSDPSRVSFRQGDAMNLPPDLGTFDAVLLANLLCRLSDPGKCLAALRALVNPGGQLVIATPCTWLAEFTPRERWLGGFVDETGTAVRTLDSLRASLEPDFVLIASRDLAFLIREHARKYQWSVAQVSTWVRRDAS